MTFDPPLNLMAYRPKARYQLHAVWGNSMIGRPGCTFYIGDVETGAEVRRYRSCSLGVAIGRRPELVREVRAMNRRDAT